MTNSASGFGDRALGRQVEPRAAPSTDDAVAARLRGFGPLGILAILVIVAGNLVGAPLTAALLVLLWVRASRTPWAEIGYVRPRSWGASLAKGVVFGIFFKILMKAIVMPLLGADPINPAYHYLVGNRAALPAMLLAVIFSAGFGEETVHRGYLFERLGKLLGTGRGAKAAAVILTAVLFGLAHYPGQGLPGAEQAVIVGLVFGVIFAATGQIWMLMCAHVAFDLTAVAIIYWNLETAAAHLILG